LAGTAAFCCFASALYLLSLLQLPYLIHPLSLP